MSSDLIQNSNRWYHPSLVKIAWLLGTGILGVIVWTTFIGLRTAAREIQCRSKLKQIGLALHNYHETYQCFPPAYLTDASGNPMHSWRVLILPFLGRKDLYNAYRFDEPWNGPNNSRLAELLSIYSGPADPSSVKGTTNYVAVVGPTTIWPGSWPMRIRDMIDGTSSTIMVVETVNSGIHWMEPRDISYEDAGAGINVKDGGFSSRHPSWSLALFGDGAVRQLSADTEPEVVRAFVSAASGTIQRGMPLPREYAQKLNDAASRKFPPVAKAESLKATDILPHTSAKHVPGRNILYCGTFQLAWNELKNTVIKAPIQLSGSPAMAQELNRGLFTGTDLSNDAYLALAGLIEQGIADKIQQELHQKFPAAQPVIPPIPSLESGIYAYAYLQKVLPFAASFDPLPEPLAFPVGSRGERVNAFGIEEFTDEPGKQKQWKGQVHILDYLNDDDFILQLITTRKDELVLAKVEPASSLAETIAKVDDRIARKWNYPRKRLEPGESLKVPIISVNVLREYTELLGRIIQNPGSNGLPILSAGQAIRFRLDESGAILESEADILAAVDDPPPLKPRHLIFNKPFLLTLREPTSKHPYFALWIENTELLEKPAP